ncbi:MAG: FAD-binding oxidoreductase [Candidatus Andersenbacteria bacterium]
MARHESWGRYPVATHQKARVLHWRPNDLRPLLQGSLLPYGLGRSQGDSCLNENGYLLDTSSLDRFISFDEATGVLCGEAGVTLKDILDTFVPRGWFLPVVPGTQFVTLGGAIANDIHGKNHRRAGSFGGHVLRFELLRSDGQRYLCAPTSNAPLFAATIGGLGLTGLITWAAIQLKPLPTPYLEVTTIPFSNLEEFFSLIGEYQDSHEYLIGQFDGVVWRRHVRSRGVLMLGNHSQHKVAKHAARGRAISIPLIMPNWLLNDYSLKVFNWLYQQRQGRKKKYLAHYQPYFFPLDSLQHWNRLYGKRGFLQYQCVVPHEAATAVMQTMLQVMAAKGLSSYLASLKTFGESNSPGLLSFPRPGIVLALDFPFRGIRTLKLLEKFDQLVGNASGAVYPAKDARMSTKSFCTYYPRWQEFSRHVDPNFSSSWWRRVRPLE